MTDRIQVLIAVPRDDALPVDVQGVGLRRKAIELMQEIATVNESTVRFRGARDDCSINIGGNVISTWQCNLLAARFYADGSALDGVCGPVNHTDPVTRFHSSAGVARDEFAR